MLLFLVSLISASTPTYERIPLVKKGIDNIINHWREKRTDEQEISYRDEFKKFIEECQLFIDECKEFVSNMSINSDIDDEQCLNLFLNGLYEYKQLFIEQFKLYEHNDINSLIPKDEFLKKATECFIELDNEKYEIYKCALERMQFFTESCFFADEKYSHLSNQVISDSEESMV